MLGTPPKDIIIVSAGKFAREVYGFVKHAIAAGQKWRIKGFLDSRPARLGGFNYPVPILCSVESYEPGENDLFLCAIGTPSERRQYSEMVLRKGGRFATLIHPTAVLGDNITLGQGVMIAPLAVLTSDIVLGDSVYVGPSSICSHDNRVGDWCHITGHCSFGGNVIVEEGCFFGMRSVVVPGVHIGKDAFIGVGSVVLRRVRAGARVFGNPAVDIVPAEAPARGRLAAGTSNTKVAVSGSAGRPPADRSESTVEGPTASQPLPGYLNRRYAASFNAFGFPRELPRAGGWLLERQIPNSPYLDAMGCYPLFCCQNWTELQADLDTHCEGLVSVALVADPFGEYTEDSLKRSFDSVIRFKEHFVVDLGKSAPVGSAHHRKSARLALGHMDVHVAANPVDHLEDWVRLYDRLIYRHQLKGIKAFSRAAFRQQLSLPGVVLFLASRDGVVIGGNIWIVQNDVAYAHLLAMDNTGYELRAAYALTHTALEYMKQFARWANLGGNPGRGPRSGAGLSSFKAGWATETRTALLCGRILQPGRYAELTRRTGTEGSSYFPAYRSGELA